MVDDGKKYNSKKYIYLFIFILFFWKIIVIRFVNVEIDPSLWYVS
jgi:hypothetical protein